MDVTSAILQVVQDSCQCVYGQSEVDGKLFRCFDGSEDSVTYRARLLATAEVGTQSLVSSLEQWAAAGSSVMVERGVALTVDADCSVEISDRLQKEAECGAEQTDEADHTAAVAGAVVGGVLAALIAAAIITTIVIIIVIVMRR